MKRIVVSIFALALGLSAASQTVVAQSDLHLNAYIPFAFVADGNALNPGTYEVTQLRPSVIVLRNLTEGSATILKTSEDVRALETKGRTLLVFRRYGNLYFLNQLTLASSESARRIRRSPAERLVAEKISKPQLIEVSLSSPSEPAKASW